MFHYKAPTQHPIALAINVVLPQRVPLLWTCEDDAMDGGKAQFPAVRRRSCERVLSTPLLPFPVGLATRRERHNWTIDEAERCLGTFR